MVWQWIGSAFWVLRDQAQLSLYIGTPNPHTQTADPKQTGGSWGGGG